MLGASGLGLAMTSGIVGPAHAAGDEAVFLTWGGYEDPAFHGAYLAKHGVSPDHSLSGDEDEMFQKIKAGFNADLAHPTTANTHRWLEAGLSQPIDTSKLVEWDNLFAALKAQPGVQSGGQTLSVPFDWGRTSVVYRTDKIQMEEESWGVLWDERNKGRIAVLGGVDDLIPAAALYAGINPYTMTAEQEATVLGLIEEQKSLVLFYADDMTTVQQGLASGELWAAMAWDEAAISLASEGLPVRFMQPKEGMLSWLGGIVLLQNGGHTDRAYDLLNALLDPATGEYLINEYGYGHSNSRSYASISDDQLEALQLPRDPSTYLSKSNFVQTIPNKSSLATRLAEIKAAF